MIIMFPRSSNSLHWFCTIPARSLARSFNPAKHKTQQQFITKFMTVNDMHSTRMHNYTPSPRILSSLSSRRTIIHYPSRLIPHSTTWGHMRSPIPNTHPTTNNPIAMQSPLSFFFFFMDSFSRETTQQKLIFYEKQCSILIAHEDQLTK